MLQTLLHFLIKIASLYSFGSFFLFLLFIRPAKFPWLPGWMPAADCQDHLLLAWRACKLCAKDTGAALAANGLNLSADELDVRGAFMRFCAPGAQKRMKAPLTSIKIKVR